MLFRSNHKTQPAGRRRLARRRRLTEGAARRTVRGPSARARPGVGGACPPSVAARDGVARAGVALLPARPPAPAGNHGADTQLRERAHGHGARSQRHPGGCGRSRARARARWHRPPSPNSRPGRAPGAGAETLCGGGVRLALPAATAPAAAADYLMPRGGDHPPASTGRQRPRLLAAPSAPLGTQASRGAHCSSCSTPRPPLCRRPRLVPTV